MQHISKCTQTRLCYFSQVYKQQLHKISGAGRKTALLRAPDRRSCTRCSTPSRARTHTFDLTTDSSCGQRAATREAARAGHGGAAAVPPASCRRDTAAHTGIRTARAGPQPSPDPPGPGPRGRRSRRSAGPGPPSGRGLPGRRRRSPPGKNPRAEGAERSAGRPRLHPRPGGAAAPGHPQPLPPARPRTLWELPRRSPSLPAPRAPRPGRDSGPPATSLQRPRAAIAHGPAAPSRPLGRRAGPRSRSRRPSGVNSPGETPRPAPAAAEPGPPLRPPAGRAAAPVAPSRSGSSSSGAAAAPAGPNPLWPPGPRRHVPGPALWKPLCPGPAPGLGSARTPDTPRPAAPGPDVLRPERLRPGQLVPPAGRALGPGGAEGDAGLRPGPTAMAAARLGPRLAGNTCKAHLHGEHSSKIFALPKRWKTISQRQPQPQQLLLGVPHRGMAPARHTRLILCLLITFVQPGSELEPPKCSRPMPVKPIAVNVQRK